MIKWSKTVNETADLCGKTPHGTWDVIHGMFDGWVVYIPWPRTRYVHNGTEWVESSLLRGKPGAVTREEARLFAESCYNEIMGLSK